MPRVFLALLCLLTLLCLLAGCSTQPPRISVQSAALTERTDAGMVVNLTMLADNPNSDALPLRDVTYTVWLADKPVFAGVRSAQATVARYGTQTFALLAAFPLDAAPAGGTQPFRVSGTLRYLVPGALAETLFDVHVLRPSTEFRGSGIVDLSTVQAPPAPEVPGVKPPPAPSDAPGPSPD
jgi:hypothetical protein